MLHNISVKMVASVFNMTKLQTASSSFMQLLLIITIGLGVLAAFRSKLAHFSMTIFLIQEICQLSNYVHTNYFIKTALGYISAVEFFRAAGVIW